GQIRRSESSRGNADYRVVEEGLVRHRGEHCPGGDPRGHPGRGVLSRLAGVAFAAHTARRSRDSRLIGHRKQGGEPMNPVVHFEMPYANRERMAKFYQSTFAWRTQMLGEEMGNYVIATTTETDQSGPKTPGAINGGFFPSKPDWPAQHPSIVIAVDDID